MTISRRNLLQAGLAVGTLGLAACATNSATTNGQPTTSPTNDALSPSPSPTQSSTSPQPSQAPTGPAADVSHGPRDSQQVALTFHGAGDPSLARAILAEAKAASIGISVMAVGSWLESNPEFAKRIIDAGHDLGNHTMTHQAMKHLSASAANHEIARCAAELNKLVGNKGAWFRPSGTPTSNDIIRQAAFDNGYPFCVTYNVDSLDYQDPAESVVVNSVLKKVQSGDIVSLHLGHAVTTKALPKIIEGLAAKNLAPVTLTQLLKV